MVVGRCRFQSCKEASLSRLQVCPDLALVSFAEDPTADLPTEILLSIFKYRHTSARSSNTATKSISDLQLVCVRWRNVISTSPPLWTAIEVVNPNYRYLSAVRLCLERSGYLPIDVVLCEWEHSDPDFMPAICQLLAECLPRCRSLHLKSTLSRPFPNLIPLHATRLSLYLPFTEEVHIEMYWGLSLRDAEKWVTMLSKAPKLTSVVWDTDIHDGCSVDEVLGDNWIRLSPNVPSGGVFWSTITVLKTSLTLSGRTISVLSSLVSLRTLVLHDCQLDAAFDDTPPPLVWSSVERIAINASRAATRVLLAGFSFPSLKSLDIEECSVNLDHFTSFCVRSRCRLRFLSLSVWDPDAQQLETFCEVLRCELRDIQELRLDFTAPVLLTRDSRALQDVPIVPLPSLHTLHLTSRFSGFFHAALFYRFRCPALTTLDVRSPENCMSSMLYMLIHSACLVSCLNLRVRDSLQDRTSIRAVLSCSALLNLRHFSVATENADPLLAQLISLHHSPSESATHWPRLSAVHLNYVKASEGVLYGFEESRRYSTLVTKSLSSVLHFP